jgi:hypothetical protein
VIPGEPCLHLNSIGSPDDEITWEREEFKPLPHAR